MDGGSPCNMILELPLGLLNDVLVTIVTRLTNHKTSQHCVKGSCEEEQEEGKRGREEEREGKEGGKKRERRKEREREREGGTKREVGREERKEERGRYG